MLAQPHDRRAAANQEAGLARATAYNIAPQMLGAKPMRLPGGNTMSEDRIKESVVLRGAKVIGAAAGAVAVGAFAVGALAIGVLAIRRIAIQSIAVEKAKFKSLGIEELTVRHLKAGDVTVSGALKVPEV
jgi:hypothetical protein